MCVKKSLTCIDQTDVLPVGIISRSQGNTFSATVFTVLFFPLKFYFIIVFILQW